jgi:integrase
MIMLAYSAGFRIGKAVRIRVGDIDSKKKINSSPPG